MTMRRGRRPLHSKLAVIGKLQAAVVGLLFANLLAAAPANAQIVMGQVRDAGTGEPVVGATITLADTLAAPQRRVLSNSAGQFIITHTAPGQYLIQAGRLGYATIESSAIAIAEGEVVEVEVRLAVEAIPIEPLTVVVRRRETQRERDLRGYFERTEATNETNIGSTQIYTREELAQWDGFSLEDLFRFYVRWNASRQNCDPKVFLDGRQRYGPFLEDLQFMTVANIEGIELYPGLGLGEGRFWNPEGCGIVLIWSRVLPERRKKLGVVEVLALGAAAALLIAQAIFVVF